MKGILILSVILSVFVVSGCVNANYQRPGGSMPFGGNFIRPEGMSPRWNFTNFTLDEENISRVSGFFENAGSQEDVTDYCREHMFECVYYCRNVYPGHEFCAGLRDFRRMGGVPR